MLRPSFCHSTYRFLCFITLCLFPFNVLCLESEILNHDFLAPKYNVRLSVWFKGVYSTARVVAVRQLICGKRGRSLGTCRAEGAKYFLPIAWGGIIYARERIASFRNLFVLRFIYLFMAYKHSRTVFLINIFSQADLK